MGCTSCGGNRRFSKMPILDQYNKVIASNYRKLKPSAHRVTARQRADDMKRVNIKPNTKKNRFDKLIEIQFEGKRINVLNHQRKGKCIYIIGYMEGCGSCNYMKALINKILNPDIMEKINVYVLDKSITEPKGFQFSGNPTILFVENGKLVFQLGGIYNQIEGKIQSFYQS